MDSRDGLRSRHLTPERLEQHEQAASLVGLACIEGSLNQSSVPRYDGLDRDHQTQVQILAGPPSADPKDRLNIEQRNGVSLRFLESEPTRFLNLIILRNYVLCRNIGLTAIRK